MANIKIADLNSTSLTQLNTLETQEVIGGRGKGRGRGHGRGLGRWNNFYAFVNNQQTNIAIIYNYGDNSSIVVNQSNYSVINID